MTDASFRFWSFVDTSSGPSGCWLWKGSRKAAGYGQFCVSKVGKKTYLMLAHRFAMQEHLGRPLAKEELVLHKPKICATKPCVNPDHLYLGNYRQNALDRAIDGTDQHLSKSTCPHGHPYDVTYLAKNGRPYRRCRTCMRAKDARRRVALRAVKRKSAIL